MSSSPAISPRPTILLCNCANAELVPAPVRLTVLAQLEAMGQSVLAVDDLCGLVARRDPRLAALAQSAGPIRVIACFPRAVRWLFAAAEAPLPDRAMVLNMRTMTAEEILEEMRNSECGMRNEENTNTDNTSNNSELRIPNSELGWSPWFPVIDYRRCRQCRQCANFCLFGVYTVESGRIRVTNPTSCKTNCPACARMCPHAAIIFPKYPTAPINGDEVTPANISREHVGEEFGVVGGNLLETLRSRAVQIRNGEFGIRNEENTNKDNTSDNSELRIPNSELPLPPSVQRILNSARQRAADSSDPDKQADQ